ncbi:MAG: indole-3-glycerol phosphate synthase TrpC [Endomicrobiia bacterium]
MNKLHSILNKILEEKYKVVEYKKNFLTMKEIFKKIKDHNYVHRNFKKAVKRKKERISLIAECKKATPQKGIIRRNYDVKEIVKQYYNTQLVDAISVLTEEKFFYGDLYHLIHARENVPLPVLRKDFIIDEYQIYESLYYQADAVLIIVAILDEDKLKRFYEISKSLSLEVLFEIYSEEDVKKVLPLEPQMIGINNRNLENFIVDIKNTEKIMKLLCDFKDIVIVSESGISSKKDVEYLSSLGIDAILVGSYFMMSKDIQHSVKELF